MTQVELTKEFKAGLDGVIAGESKICLIDGDRKKLYYRGYNVADLALHSTFEETTFILLHGRLPNASELVNFVDELNAALYIPSQILAMVALTPPQTPPMDMLRSIVSALSQHDADVESNQEQANFRKAARLIAQAPVIVAAFHRLRQGMQPVPPNKKLGLAGNFLYMLSGELPDEYSCKVFDKCMILHADHGFNASTFTARVVAATLSDIHAAITAAIGALKGPLHGGANQQVMNMLLSVPDPSRSVEHVQKMLSEGKKIPGFGHRVYKNCEDPRATILREFSREMSSRCGKTDWFKMSEAINEFMVASSADKGKPIYPNVDFYSASTYALMDIPPDLFTPIFALSRMSGWCAHVIEQHNNNRLIRPEEQYTGDRDLDYLPLSSR